MLTVAPFIHSLEMTFQQYNKLRIGATSTHYSTMTDHISALPPEMIKAIADETNRDDLLALRATSKTLRAGSNDAFLRQFFTSRRHILSTHSLETFLSIASDPALRGRLNDFELILGQLRADDIPPEELLPNTAQRMTCQSLAQLHEADRRKQVWSKWIEERDAVLHTDVALLLSLAFRQLANAGITIIVGLSFDDACRPEAAYGFKHLSRALGSSLADESSYTTRGQYFWNREDGSARLFSAVASANLRVRQFALPSVTWAANTPFTAFSMSDALSARFKTSCSTLHRLDLTISTNTMAGADDFVAAMQCALGLEELTLRFSYHQKENDPDVDFHEKWLISAFSNARLKSIHLANSRVDRPVLLKLLNQHKATLQNLWIMYVVLKDRTTLVPVLSWIEQNLSLKDLFFFDNKSYTADGMIQIPCQGFHIRGEDKIKEEMGGWIKEFAWGEAFE